MRLISGGRVTNSIWEKAIVKVFIKADCTGWFLILLGCLLQNLSVEDNPPKAPTPLPLNELAPPPSQDELFGELSINQSFIVP